jgi:regulator of sigma E protease
MGEGKSSSVDGGSLMVILTILSIIFVFFLLIFPHELGHFISAKGCGMQVDRFSLGLGPKLWGFKKRETEYVISAFPLGGYVKIAGMEPGEKDLEKGFRRQSWSKRVGVIIAGSLMNYLVAIIMFSLIFMMGFYTFNLEEAVIGEVRSGSPAEKANLLPGDKILKVDGRQTKGWEELALSIEKSQSEVLTLEVQRKDRVFVVQIKSVFDSELSKKIIGITPSKTFRRYNPIISLSMGVERTISLTGLILASVGWMIIGKLPAQVSGPVGIIQFVGQSAGLGIIPLFSLIALLSINLGLFNLFPIPALDGGRLLFLLIEKIRGKALNLEKEEMVHYIGFIILLALILVVTYQDILRLIPR